MVTTRSRAANKGGRSSSRVEAGKKVMANRDQGALQAARSKGGKQSHTGGRGKK